MTIKVRQANRSDKNELAKMRALLWPESWPESSIEEHRKDIESALRFRVYVTLPMTILLVLLKGTASAVPKVLYATRL